MGTRILIVGSGGREHALALALASARPATDLDLLCCPGNPGIADVARLITGVGSDVDAIVRVAVEHSVDFVLPGGETFLCAGLADALARVGIACVGPTQAAAQLEASKVFTRILTAPHGVPGPHFAVVCSESDLRQALDTWSGLPVIKADGLAAGKGVFLPETIEACWQTGRALLAGSLGAAGTTLLLEERLYGEEASLFYACAGADVVALSHARDHKRLLDDDCGPNTGGMGAISPSPFLTPALEQEIEARIVRSTLQALVARGTPFVGFLFVGVMLTARGPMLLEFNVRWGDPEAQAVLPRLRDGDFLRICQALACGTLSQIQPQIDASHSCAVVLASADYPQSPRSSERIEIDPQALAASGGRVLHSGTMRCGPDLYTAGGRVLTVVAQGSDADGARGRAYRAADAVRFAGLQRRSDIGLLRRAVAPGTPTRHAH